MSYPGHSLVKSYLSAEMQSVYSTATANWAEVILCNKFSIFDKERIVFIHRL